MGGGLREGREGCSSVRGSAVWMGCVCVCFGWGICVACLVAGFAEERMKMV